MRMVKLAKSEGSVMSIQTQINTWTMHCGHETG